MSSSVDDVLRKLDVETLELLIGFREGGTFHSAARTVQLHERTARARLMELDDAFTKLRGTRILERINLRRYVLTDAGNELATQAQEITSALRMAVESIEGGRQINVVTTSNCCAELVQLMREFEEEDRFRISPHLRRTMEIKQTPPFDRDDSEFAMFSRLMRRDTVHLNQVRSIQGASIIAFKLEEIEVIAPKSVDLTAEPSVREMLRKGVTMCVPDGGVAWDYVQQGSPRWEHLQYRQRFHIPDLYAGLQALTTGLAGPRAAMIVHGLGNIKDKSSKLYPLKDLYVQRRARASSPKGDHDTGNDLVAVTGVLRALRAQQSPEQEKFSDQVWKKAEELWVTGGALTEAGGTRWIG